MTRDRDYRDEPPRVTVRATLFLMGLLLVLAGVLNQHAVVVALGGFLAGLALLMAAADSS
jgi:hypothetical protein